MCVDKNFVSANTVCQQKQCISQTVYLPKKFVDQNRVSIKHCVGQKSTLNKHLVELNSLLANTVCWSKKFVNQNSLSDKKVCQT